MRRKREIRRARPIIVLCHGQEKKINKNKIKWNREKKKVGGPSSLERRIQRPSRAPLSFLNSVVVFLVMSLPGLTVLVCFFLMKINIFGPFSSSSLCYISLFTFFIPFFLNFILHFGLTFLSLVYLVHTYSLLFVLYSTSQYIEFVHRRWQSPCPSRHP